MASNTEIHFEVVQIYAPYVSGTCTLPPDKFWPEGYHTPLTCVESSNATWCYSFSTSRIGSNELLAFRPTDLNTGQPITYAMPDRIKSITETAAVLSDESGLASRPSFSCVMSDFNGDPGPVNTTTDGTYFSKLIARNIMDNRDCYLLRYKMVDNVISLVSSSHYYVDSFSVTASNDYVLRCKSTLERTHQRNKKFPPPTGARLRLDIDQATTTIPVFGGASTEYGADFAAGQVIRVGNEFMKIISVNGTGNSATLTVPPRGSTIVGDIVPLTTTVAESHDSGDNIQICHVSNQEEIYDFLSDVLISIGVPSSYIPLADWTAEIDDYWANYFINTIWSEPLSGREVIDRVCKAFMLDMWEDTETSTIRLSAVSVWKYSPIALSIGRGIEYSSLRGTQLPDLRTSQTYIRHDMKNKASNDTDIESYEALAQYNDTQYNGTDYYGREKVVELEASPIHTTQSAEIRTQRNTVRFSITPRRFEWLTQEKYKNYAIGDVISIPSGTVQPDGSPEVVRCQVMKVNPKYNNIGREYACSGLSYLAAFGGDTGGGAPGEGQLVITLSGNLTNVDLWVQAGAISTAVDVLVIFDGATIGSTAYNIPAVSAASFHPDSTITIVCINNCKWSAKGGDGGGTTNYAAGDGLDGAICLDAGAVVTSVYLSGDYTSDIGVIYNCSGWMKAPGGGGGGGVYSWIQLPYDGNYHISKQATGAGGQGITGGIGGSGSKTSEWTYTEYYEGTDGSISDHGYGQEYRVTSGAGRLAKGGDGGGFGQPGIAGEGYFNSSEEHYEDSGIGGIAGGAVNGSGVTIHKTGSNLILGNSDPVTIVEV